MYDTIIDTVNDDGTTTRVSTQNLPDGGTLVETHILTADQIQAEQDDIQTEIDALTEKLIASQETTSQIQKVNSLKTINK